MKKLVKISILMFIIGLCLSIKSFAASPYLLEFSEQNSVEMGETIEVPLVLKNINPDDTIKYLKSVKCNISCDESAFEIVGFTTELNTEESTYVKYNAENKSVIYSPELGSIKESLTEITELGKAKIKVKSEIAEGYYNLFVQNIEAGNGNELLTIENTSTPIFVNGIKQETEEDEKEIEQTDIPTENGVKVVGNEFKAIKLKIQMKKDGTQLVITADEENGGKVGTLKVNGKEIERKDGKYVVETEPNTYYRIDAYDVNGNIASSDSVITTVAGNAEDTEKPDNTDKQSDEEKKDDENKNNTDNKEDDKNKENDNKEDSNKEEGKTDTNTEKENTNKSSEDVKKSPQTGDTVYTAIILLVVATFAWIIAYGMKYVKDE